MNKTKLTYQETGYFSKLMVDMLAGKDELKPFYNQPFSVEGFKNQIDQKQLSDSSRNVLVQTLQTQYKELDITQKVKSNISSLINSNTYTITTGHQLNLFTGPLYFIYKIVSAINIAKELKAQYPGKNFVPVYWMATEDHDFEEINHFNLFGKKHEIARTKNGAVGRMSLKGIDQVFEELEQTLENRTGLEGLITKLKESYKAENTFTQAIRTFVNNLFGKYGLVIIDGDDKSLKQLFSQSMEKELVQKENYKLVKHQSDELTKLGYPTQVNPREINLFYLKDNLRERIVEEQGVYKVLNTDIEFSKESILEELQQSPEQFSPNVVLRPLYQETILPNLAYIGGGGELAYWHQLKKMFEANEVLFPILTLRNSALIVDGNNTKKVNKLGLETKHFFNPLDDLIKNYLKEGSEILLDLKAEEKSVELVFEDIVSKAGKIDPSLQPMIKAELQKSIKSLKNIESRLIKAEKRKEEVAVNQITNVKAKLFPKNSLQERQENFIYLALILGDTFIDELLDVLDPFEKEFTILSV